jgi:hypothetical protein
VLSSVSWTDTALLTDYVLKEHNSLANQALLAQASQPVTPCSLPRFGNLVAQMYH